MFLASISLMIWSIMFRAVDAVKLLYGKHCTGSAYGLARLSSGLTPRKYEKQLCVYAWIRTAPRVTTLSQC